MDIPGGFTVFLEYKARRSSGTEPGGDTESTCYKRGKQTMSKYKCPCEYIYDPELGDPENGVAPGTAFENLPDEWVCPWCGAEKQYFEKVE
jgi:rubredoxin